MARTTENNPDWSSLAILQLEQLAKSRAGWANTEYGVTGEDIRAMLITHVGYSSSPNAWGALVNRAVRKGIIVAAGQYRAMKDVRSHARETPIYRFA